MSYSERTPFEDRHPYSPRHPRPSEIQSHPQGIEHIAPRKSSTASTISRLFSLSRHRQVAPIAQTSTLTLSKSSEARPGNATAVSASRKARSGRIDDSGGHRLLVTGSALPFDDADHRQVVKIKRHTTLLGQRLTLSRDSLDPPNPSRLPLPTSSVCDDALAGMNAVQDKRIYSSSFRQPYASPVDYSLRLKLSRNQIASFRKVSAGYPSRPDLLRRSPLPILRKRKLASSRPKQALRYATDSPDLPTAPRSFTPTSNSGPSTPSPTCKLDSRPRSLEIESPFPSTPQVIRRFVLQDTTALDLLHTSPSCKSCAVPRPDTNRSKNSRTVNEIQSAVISPQLRLLCDRPLPRIPSVERPSIRRKSAPSGISGASSDALPDERIDSAIKGLDNIYVNGNKGPESLRQVDQYGSPSTDPAECVSPLATPPWSHSSLPMTTDTFHRFSKMELEEQFLDVLGHLGSFGDPEDEFSVHPLDELSGERQMLSDSAEDTGTMRLRASPARTAEVVDAAGSTVDLDFFQDSVSFGDNLDEPDDFSINPDWLDDQFLLSSTPSRSSRFKDTLPVLVDPAVHSTPLSFSSTVAKGRSHPVFTNDAVLAVHTMRDSLRPRFIPSGRSFEPIRRAAQLSVSQAKLAATAVQVPNKEAQRPMAGKVKDAVHKLESQTRSNAKTESPVTPVRVLGRILDQPSVVMSTELSAESKRLSMPHTSLDDRQANDSSGGSAFEAFAATITAMGSLRDLEF